MTDKLNLAKLSVQEEDANKNKSPVKRPSNTPADELSPLKKRLLEKKQQVQEKALSCGGGDGDSSAWPVIKVLTSVFKSIISQLQVFVVETKETKDKDGNLLLYVVLADATGALLADVPGSLAADFTVGRSLRLAKTWWYNKVQRLRVFDSSDVSVCANVTPIGEVPTLEAFLQEYFNRNFSTIAALHSKTAQQEHNNSFNVRAVVISAMEVKHYYDKTQKMQRDYRPLLVQDETGTIELVMWGPDSVRLFDEGSTVEFTMLSLRNYQRKNTLNSHDNYTLATVVTAADSSKVYTIPHEYQAKFGAPEPANDIRIIAIRQRSTYTYAACNEKACRMKKVNLDEQPAKCTNPRCNKVYEKVSDALLGVRMTVEVETGGQQHHVRSATLFTDSVQKLLPELAELSADGYDATIDAATLIEAIGLPQRIKGTFSNDILRIDSLV